MVLELLQYETLDYDIVKHDKTARIRVRHRVVPDIGSQIPKSVLCVPMVDPFAKIVATTRSQSVQTQEARLEND